MSGLGVAARPSQSRLWTRAIAAVAKHAVAVNGAVALWFQVYRFSRAVVIEAPDLGELGIFTEHCGYHIFPLHETRIHIQDGL
jgi:hypothetical protein